MRESLKMLTVLVLRIVLIVGAVYALQACTGHKFCYKLCEARKPHGSLEVQRDLSTYLMADGDTCHCSYVQLTSFEFDKGKTQK